MLIRIDASGLGECCLFHGMHSGLDLFFEAMAHGSLGGLCLLYYPTRSMQATLVYGNAPTNSPIAKAIGGVADIHKEETGILCQ